MTEIKLFTCPNLPGNLRLSPLTCGKRWHAARADCVMGGVCGECDIGRKNAGASTPKGRRRKFGISNFCVRCHRGARRLVQRLLCVSCQNRQYEYLRGRNAKGTQPVRHPALYDINVAYLTGDTLHRDTIRHAASILEAVLVVARNTRDPVAFFRATPACTRQITLFGGV